MKPTYVQAVIEENDKLKLEIAELRQALTGRTVSCVFCNDSAKELDKAREDIEGLEYDLEVACKERDLARIAWREARAMMVTLCHKVVAAALSEEKEDIK